MQHEMVYACIRDKAESIGQLPVMMYKMQNGKKVSVISSGLEHKIFTKKPNSFMTMQDLKENYMSCQELYGRYFAYVSRNKYGNVAEILPFRFQQGVSVNMDTAGNVYYTYATNDGKPAMAFSGGDIMHIKLNTLDGFTGLSPIQAGARAIGINISQQEYIGNMMESGVAPKGILTTEATFKDDNAAKRIRTQWQAYSGAKGAGKTPVLENGLKYQSMSVSPADSELLLQMNYGRESICLLFGVPLERFGINKNSKATPQEVSVNYLKKLNPAIVKFEDAINALLPEGKEIELDRKGFVKGDPQSQAKTVETEMKMGLISLNEGRIDLGRIPVDGGDVHAIDTNNLTFGELTDIPKLQEQARLAAQPNKPKDAPAEDDTDES